MLIGLLQTFKFKNRAFTKNKIKKKYIFIFIHMQMTRHDFFLKSK